MREKKLKILPKIPKIIMHMSFHKIHLYFPKLPGQKVTISMIGGKIKASVELETAPTSEITDPKLGIIAANKNVSKTSATRKA